ncbi:hypothetical protein BD410DRAFT_584345 [Rickenella mellea]|uniref:Uncharacterized protein n=1 Tax=Rickenella mellea TaxID=50990 RepID=A0A4Y7PPP7_9AGAM|nr:hypothetical protein BD410DRAFT_584345 [Rickenella mellea]
MHRESGLETCSADGSDGCRPEDCMIGLSTPSRSPTPPTEVVHHQPGKHVFTDGDKAYFVRFLKWWIQKNPESDIYSNRGKIVESLSENVPSHSIGSWGNYWRRQEETIHKIVAKANRKERRCPSDDEMPSSNNPTIATLGHADDLASAKLDEPFNRAERHALAKRILLEGSYIAWKDLPKDQQWYGIDPDNKLPSQSELAWSTRFGRDEMGQKKIERLVEKHITKQARMSGTQVAEGDTEFANAPHSLNQSNGLDESLEAEAHQDALPSTLAIADGPSEKRVAPQSDPGPSPPAKKIRIEMEEGGPESI